MPNSYNKLSNKELIRLCQRDPVDQLAWTEFYNRFHKTIAKFIFKWNRQYKLRHQPDDFTNYLLDLTQTILMKLIDDERRAIKSFRNETDESIYAYLAKMAKYSVINYSKHYSAAKRNAPTVSMFETIAFSSEREKMERIDILASSSDDLVENRRYRERVEELREKIKTQKKNKNWQRDLIIFDLAFIHELKAHEIADVSSLEISEKRIANRITELKKILSGA